MFNFLKNHSKFKKSLMAGVMCVVIIFEVNTTWLVSVETPRAISSHCSPSSPSRLHCAERRELGWLANTRNYINDWEESSQLSWSDLLISARDAILLSGNWHYKMQAGGKYSAEWHSLLQSLESSNKLSKTGQLAEIKSTEYFFRIKSLIHISHSLI